MWDSLQHPSALSQTNCCTSVATILKIREGCYVLKLNKAKSCRIRNWFSGSKLGQIIPFLSRFSTVIIFKDPQMLVFVCKAFLSYFYNDGRRANLPHAIRVLTFEPPCLFWRRGMRNSTGSPIFSDFKSDLSRVVRFPTAGQGERRPWVRGCTWATDVSFQLLLRYGWLWTTKNLYGFCIRR